MYSPIRRYLVELTITMLAYFIALFVSLFLLNLSLPSLLRILIALMPMLPACFVPIVVVRLLRRLDELHRQIHLEALSFAFVGTALLTFAYGFLQTVGFPQVSWFWVWGIMATLWLIASLRSAWRYLH